MPKENDIGLHKVEIPEDVIERIVARRGSLHIYESIDPVKTALLAIDMQNCFAEPGACMELPRASAIVDNINALAVALRQAGGQVVWTKHCFRPEWTVWYNHLVAGEWRERVLAEAGVGSWGHQISAKMDVQEQDWSVEKTEYSALFPDATEPDLATRLRERDIEMLLITGGLSNVCCEATARDANALGLDLIMISDAMVTRSDVEHNMALCNTLNFLGDVHTTARVLAMIE